MFSEYPSVWNATITMTTMKVGTRQLTRSQIKAVPQKARGLAPVKYWRCLAPEFLSLMIKRINVPMAKPIPKAIELESIPAVSKRLLMVDIPTKPFLALHGRGWLMVLIWQVTFLLLVVLWATLHSRMLLSLLTVTAMAWYDSSLK